MSKKQRLIRYLQERNPAVVGEDEWRGLLRDLAPISEGYLRRLLLETGRPFAQPFAGIRQRDFDELEQSLIEMEKVYAEAVAAGDRERARYCRRQVIQAKDHARFAARSPKSDEAKRAQKEEMIQWMLVWLENPGVFPAWVKLRREAWQKGPMIA